MQIDRTGLPKIHCNECWFPWITSEQKVYILSQIDLGSIAFYIFSLMSHNIHKIGVFDSNALQ